MKQKLLLVGFCFLSNVAQSESDSEKTTQFSYDLKLIERVTVTNSVGNVNLAPSLGKKAHVLINKIKWGPRCHIEVELIKGTLKVESDEQAWIQDQECRADIVMSIPKEVPLSIRSGNGDVKIIASRGSVDVKVESGLIRLSGDMNQIRAEAKTGHIQMKGSVQKATLQTGSGNIEMDYSKLSRASSIEAKTEAGDVEVYLPDAAKVKSQISAGNGQVLNEFQSDEGQTPVQIGAESSQGNILIRKK